MPEHRDSDALCPHPDHDTVTCPNCRADVPGVVPAGTSDDPAARCPACESVVESVIVPG